MTPAWWDVLGRGWQLMAAGFLLWALVGIVAGPGEEYSCAPADPDDEDDADDLVGDAWDRGHDRWVADRDGVL
ncbi:hypothetical protein [Nocardia sp. CC227C]|uniref:hypothetical protein n=1 Tax=Nocardia sp. CC227C TaxID=3044562 RepID=UPI00278BD9CD|nr:hypothetical protein [Nocardia sp. CC227C]